MECLLRYEEEVKKEPQNWLPWNFPQTIDTFRLVPF
jgi:hypothetical protein